MFSRYKKSGGEPGKTAGAPTAKSAQAAPAAAPVTASIARNSMSATKPSIVPAKASPEDKEKKRKERMGDIKLELHKRLLDNLNLAALETASANDLRQEIVSISAEALEEMSVVLNKEERTILHQ
jgi:pilus assembly protein CpaF